MLKILTYITDYKLESIKKKLLILYMLNLTDILFTMVLLDTGYFIEANPLISSMINNTRNLVLIKVILPIILLLYIYVRIKNATRLQLLKSNTLINIAQLFYAMLNLLHLFWFAWLLFQISFNYRILVTL